MYVELMESIRDVFCQNLCKRSIASILLAEFLQQLRKPEREEYSNYIYNIYNVLCNEEQWSQDPYVEGLKNIYRNAKLLSKALKRLFTFIKKIIERMVREESLESLTENIIELNNK